MDDEKRISDWCSIDDGIVCGVCRVRGRRSKYSQTRCQRFRHASLGIRREKSEKEGITIELVKFSDYVQPNLALAEGEIDANSFQTVSYFNAFKKEHNLKLSPIATTVIAPMGIYSDKVKDVKDIPVGGKIAVPNEATNMGRALLLLQEARPDQIAGRL